MDPAKENLVAIITTENEVHEVVLSGALRDDEIDFVIKSFDDNVFDGITESHYGHSRILVLEENVEKAKQAISEIPAP